MALIKSVISFLLIIAIAWFCIINAQSVDIIWSPIHDPLTLPLYTTIIGGLIIGFAIGTLLTWINSGHVRKEKRRQKKQIKSLEKELEKNTTAISNQKPPADFFPALPNKSES